MREALAHARTSGNIRLTALILVNLADVHIVQADHAAAIPLLTEGIELLETIGDVAYSPWAHLVLGLALGRQHDEGGGPQGHRARRATGA